MHLFVSAGEPSGDLHGANLVEILRHHEPSIKIVGLGGDKMVAAGVDLHYPLTDLAVMWIGRALIRLPTFLRIARQAEVYFRTHRPDAVIVIDYPGFHWALAKRAHRAGIPVYYFVPPQLWAWAGWRVSKMQRWIKTVLTALPFEEKWYRDRGVETHYIGHPYFDELAVQKLDQGYFDSQRRVDSPLVTLLPGSRGQEVTANFPLMIAAAHKIQAAVPNVRFCVAAFKESQAAVVREMLLGSGLPIEVQIGRTPELIEAADACLAVSGSVGLELMYRLKPTVVVYKITPFARFVSRQFMTCKYISLVNLLADETLFPEYLTKTDSSDEIASHIIGWLKSPASRDVVVERLRKLREQVAIPGACERAAAFLLNELRPKQR